MHHPGDMEIPALVSPEYCFPHETQLILKPQRKLFAPIHHKIEDLEGTLVFDVKQIDSWRQKRVLCDPSGWPIVLLKYKFGFGALKWTAYRDADENDANLLFTIRTSTGLNWICDVYLPTNNTRDDSSTPDFILEGNSKDGKHTLLHNDKPIAKAENISITSRKHLVTIYPGVDRAFIAALFTALDLMRRRDMYVQLIPLIYALFVLLFICILPTNAGSLFGHILLLSIMIGLVFYK